MRNIIFRAWNKRDKYIVSSPRSICTILQHRMGLPQHAGWNSYNEQSSKDDYVLMQYTGVKDNNGKMIFEGDILKDINTIDDEVLGFVEFSKGLYEVGMYSLYYVAVECKCLVVGNIHDNKLEVWSIRER